MTIDKIPTTIPGLDELTYGGLPRGRSTLITGKSGTAKSVLALQLACSFASRGVPTLMISIEESPDDLLTTADGLGFPARALVERGALVLADLTRPLDAAVIYAGEFDLAGLLHTVNALVEAHAIEAVVLDSATALFSPRPTLEVMRSLFYQLVATFRTRGLTSVITAEALEDYGAQLTTLGVEDFICDVVIVMRNLLDDQRRRRSIEVHKYRRSRHYKGEYPFTITNEGIVVFPLDAQGGREVSADVRFSSGVAGLDEMTGGGLLRDAIVLVRGPTGSGKTTLAGLYARAGARRGEHVTYYGFEETKSMLLRNFRALGMPLDELEAAGTLRVHCRYPEATSPEDLLIDVRASLHAHMPSLMVFDSISSIAHSTSERGFRQFLVGLAALVREHSRSALLIQTVAPSETADVGTPFLSTIPDAIVLLDYELRDEELARSVRVLKMRGSRHVSGRRRVHLGDGGLRVDPGATPPKLA